jgi:hypothetical protein
VSFWSFAPSGRALFAIFVTTLLGSSKLSRPSVTWACWASAEIWPPLASLRGMARRCHGCHGGHFSPPAMADLTLLQPGHALFPLFPDKMRGRPDNRSDFLAPPLPRPRHSPTRSRSAPPAPLRRPFTTRGGELLPPPPPLCASMFSFTIFSLTRPLQCAPPRFGAKHGGQGSPVHPTRPLPTSSDAQRTLPLVCNSTLPSTTSAPSASSPASAASSSNPNSLSFYDSPFITCLYVRCCALVSEAAGSTWNWWY